nr:MAG TPA: hypothetical protein [Caudoviricetes sp.]
MLVVRLQYHENFVLPRGMPFSIPSVNPSASSLKNTPKQLFLNDFGKMISPVAFTFSLTLPH